MTDLLATESPGRGSPRPRLVSRRELVGFLLAMIVIAIALVVVVVHDSATPPPDTGAAQIVPADALAYVNLSIDMRRLPVREAVDIGDGFPDYPLASAAVQTRLGSILAGGKTVDFASLIGPWLGDEAALALLNTTTSTAGTLIILDVRDPARARAFIQDEGAAPGGSYRGTRLYAYRTGNELAFVSHYLVVGQDSSVRSAIDVASGASPALANAGPYQQATANQPNNRVLDAYASLAGVRRLLSPQGGVIGAVGGLLYQPALQGVAVSVSPAGQGARVLIHSALDPSLTKLSAGTSETFTPTLQSVMPEGSILMLDVHGLDRVAPGVLNAGSTAGVAGGIGPLLSRLGTALGAEGVNVHDVASIFSGETAVAIVPHGQSPTLVIVARTHRPAQAQTELAQLEVPLAQLVAPPNSGSGQVPQFKDRSAAGITDHQLVLSSGLELDYAVFRGMVVISTSLQGVTDVAQQTRTLAADPRFRFAVGGRPAQVSSLVYLNLPALLALSQSAGLTSSASYRRLAPDLKTISAVGLTSTHSRTDSTAQLAIHAP